MSAFDTIKAADAAFDRNDPSVLFAAMDPAIAWNEAEGYPFAAATTLWCSVAMAARCRMVVRVGFRAARW